MGPETECRSASTSGSMQINGGDMADQMKTPEARINAPLSTSAKTNNMQINTPSPMNIPTPPDSVYSRFGQRIEICDIKRIIAVPAEPPESIGIPDKTWHWIIEAELVDGTSKDSPQKVDPLELRNGLHEDMMREYMISWAAPGIDFILQDHGRQMINPRYIEQFPEAIRPAFFSSNE